MYELKYLIRLPTLKFWTVKVKYHQGHSVGVADLYVPRKKISDHINWTWEGAKSNETSHF